MISPESRPQASDRIFKLEIIDGKKPLSSIGTIDPRLFKDGEDSNKLHGVMDPETCLWSFKYEKGAVPPALKGQFTGIKAMKKYADLYFAQRNIKVVDLEDAVASNNFG